MSGHAGTATHGDAHHAEVEEEVGEVEEGGEITVTHSGGGFYFENWTIALAVIGVLLGALVLSSGAHLTVGWDWGPTLGAFVVFLLVGIFAIFSNQWPIKIVAILVGLTILGSAILYGGGAFFDGASRAIDSLTGLIYSMRATDQMNHADGSKGDVHYFFWFYGFVLLASMVAQWAHRKSQGKILAEIVLAMLSVAVGIWTFVPNGIFLDPASALASNIIFLLGALGAFLWSLIVSYAYSIYEWIHDRLLNSKLKKVETDEEAMVIIDRFDVTTSILLAPIGVLATGLNYIVTGILINLVNHTLLTYDQGLVTLFMGELFGMAIFAFITLARTLISEYIRRGPRRQSQ